MEPLHRRARSQGLWPLGVMFSTACSTSNNWGGEPRRRRSSPTRQESSAVAELPTETNQTGQAQPETLRCRGHFPGSPRPTEPLISCRRVCVSVCPASSKKFSRGSAVQVAAIFEFPADAPTMLALFCPRCVPAASCPVIRAALNLRGALEKLETLVLLQRTFSWPYSRGVHRSLGPQTGGGPPAAGLASPEAEKDCTSCCPARGRSLCLPVALDMIRDSVLVTSDVSRQDVLMNHR